MAATAATLGAIHAATGVPRKLTVHSKLMPGSNFRKKQRMIMGPLQRAYGIRARARARAHGLRSTSYSIYTEICNECDAYNEYSVSTAP